MSDGERASVLLLFCVILVTLAMVSTHEDKIVQLTERAEAC